MSKLERQENSSQEPRTTQGSLLSKTFARVYVRDRTPNRRIWGDPDLQVECSVTDPGPCNRYRGIQIGGDCGRTHSKSSVVEWERLEVVD